MGPEKQTAVLYDFLYRDSNRLASYYTQVFTGHVVSIEQTSTLKSGTETAGKADIKIAHIERKSSEGTEESAKHIIAPHDLITTDVLTALRDAGYFRDNPTAAPHGSLVLVKGTVAFIDKGMLAMASAALEATVKAEEKKPRHKRDPNIEGMRFIREFLVAIELPSAFLLQTDDGVQLSGTLKEAGMEEPISTYYFKHGEAGLAGVYLLGIKEVPSTAFTLPHEQLIGAGREAARGLTNMLFPPNTIRITPLVMFRQVLGPENSEPDKGTG